VRDQELYMSQKKILDNMSEIITIEKIKGLILEIRNTKVLLDSDVSALYGIQTKRINEAVKNNPDKFPEGYLIELNESDLAILRTKFSTTKLSKTRSLPKAFTEKGLYMLATILKSQVATQTTINIIETFSRIRELSKNVKELSVIKEEKKQKSLMKKSSEIIAELLDNNLSVSDTETSIELNFAVLKFRHTIKKGKK